MTKRDIRMFENDQRTIELSERFDVEKASQLLLTDLLDAKGKRILKKYLSKLSGNATASSLPCVARIHQRISVASIQVESQADARTSGPSALVGEPYSRLRDVRDVSPRAPGISWLKKPG